MRWTAVLLTSIGHLILAGIATAVVVTGNLEVALHGHQRDHSQPSQFLGCGRHYTAHGIVTVTMENTPDGLFVGAIAPSRYSANSSGWGVAAATYSADGRRAAEWGCPASAQAGGPSSRELRNVYVSTGLASSAGPPDPEALRNGLGGFSRLENVPASIVNARTEFVYAGEQGQFVGSQINRMVPRSLAGGKFPEL